MTGAERAIRWSTVGAVVLVAVIAGIASYEHAYTVVSAHGEHGIVARIYPGTIDGLIYAASMVLLDSARRRAPAPAMARWLLAAGITATLAANILAGIAYGLLGAIVAAWPAPALVGSYELLMWLVRTGTVTGHEAATPAASDQSPAGQRPRKQAATSRRPVRSAEDIEAAALSALATNPAMTCAELAEAIGTSDRTARRVRARLAAPDN